MTYRFAELLVGCANSRRGFHDSAHEDLANLISILGRFTFDFPRFRAFQADWRPIIVEFRL